MQVFLAIAGGAVGLGAGIAGGWWIGIRIRERHPAVYWVANAGALVAGMMVAYLGMWWQQLGLAVAGLGLLGGGLTGLKYGYAHVVGQWRDHDRMTEINQED